MRPFTDRSQPASKCENGCLIASTQSQRITPGGSSQSFCWLCFSFLYPRSDLSLYRLVGVPGTHVLGVIPPRLVGGDIWGPTGVAGVLRSGWSSIKLARRKTWHGRLHITCTQHSTNVRGAIKNFRDWFMLYMHAHKVVTKTCNSGANDDQAIIVHKSG